MNTPVTWVCSHRRTLYAWWNLLPADANTAASLSTRDCQPEPTIYPQLPWKPSPAAVRLSSLPPLLPSGHRFGQDSVESRRRLISERIPPLFIPSSSQVVLIFSFITHNLKPHFLTTTGRALRVSKNEGLCSHLLVNVIQDIDLRCAIRPSFIPFVSVSRLPGAFAYSHTFYPFYC